MSDRWIDASYIQYNVQNNNNGDIKILRGGPDIVRSVLCAYEPYNLSGRIPLRAPPYLLNVHVDKY